MMAIFIFQNKLCTLHFVIISHFFITATVECYNPRTNEWNYVAKMNEPHYGHAGTVYGNYMYISGRYLLQLLFQLLWKILKLIVITNLQCFSTPYINVDQSNLTLQCHKLT